MYGKLETNVENGIKDINLEDVSVDDIDELLKD